MLQAGRQEEKKNRAGWPGVARSALQLRLNARCPQSNDSAQGWPPQGERDGRTAGRAGPQGFQGSRTPRSRHYSDVESGWLAVLANRRPGRRPPHPRTRGRGNPAAPPPPTVQRSTMLLCWPRLRARRRLNEGGWCNVETRESATIMSCQRKLQTRKTGHSPSLLGLHRRRSLDKRADRTTSLEGAAVHDRTTGCGVRMSWQD